MSEPDLGGIPPAFVVAALVLAGLAMWGVVLGLYLHRRRVARVYSAGVRGTAGVLAVEPTSVMNRRSAVERPTESVVVATRDRPRGVRTGQKVPAGMYRPGQVVPVVQLPGKPESVRLDRPDLEESAASRWAMLAVLVALPFGVARGVALVLGA